ncbi:PadR family transcriptional regulator [Halorubrum aidingense JCM 13560]|uniref:PadR family transcriptional regulator n=1 Tax=Halorubrum aidingense JCM 13560 TaxID=1230454 RepID=M0PFC8_9EURY|nr:PadR family transcriptional regulator [Halorubrum aidingense]EMA68822.1 PadR family transcriptional regulator [Halorubrum aidingense JCM 13560]
MSSAARGETPEVNGTGAVADLTAFQRDILRILDQENHQKGTSIKARLEAYYGIAVNHGRLYPNLDTLVDHGFVEKGERDRRTNDYALTDAARDALDRRDRWVAGGGE